MEIVLNGVSTYVGSACLIAIGKVYIYIEDGGCTINDILNLKMLLTSDVYYH